MWGYFVRKPMDIEEVKAEIRDARYQGIEPIEIDVIGRVMLTPKEYTEFCGWLTRDYDFLAEYADDSMFFQGVARCVLISAPDKHDVAVCLEGYNYPRYCAWPF